MADEGAQTFGGAPVVLLDPAGGSDPGLPTVGAINFAGGLSATEHLIALGHRRVAIVGGVASLPCSQERLEGYRAALQRAGLPADPALVVEGDFTSEGGQRAAASLLALAEPPTAIFAASDSMASGVYQKAWRRGLRVPDDLSVVGFDDVAMSAYLPPPLTTVHQPLAAMAAEAVRIALSTPSVHARTADRAPHLQLATHLVVRQSTAPPPRERGRSTPS